jgi:hypothetical protein
MQVRSIDGSGRRPYRVGANPIKVAHFGENRRHGVGHSPDTDEFYATRHTRGRPRNDGLLESKACGLSQTGPVARDLANLSRQPHLTKGHDRFG